MALLRMLTCSATLGFAMALGSTPAAEAASTTRQTQAAPPWPKPAVPRMRARRAQRNSTPQAGDVQRGEASVYGRQFHGRRMANGKRFDTFSNTVAHRTLPLGTRVRVTNLANGHSAFATVADRGPFVHGRILDLSHRVATTLGMQRPGLLSVRIRLIDIPRLRGA